MKKLKIANLALSTIVVATPALGADGQAVYDQYCVACHAQGVAGAPKFGDPDAWADRVTKGKPTLYEHSLNGFQGDAGVMPPKGGFSNLTDEEVKAGVDYMVDNAN